MIKEKYMLFCVKDSVFFLLVLFEILLLFHALNIKLFILKKYIK